MNRASLAALVLLLIGLCLMVAGLILGNLRQDLKRFDLLEGSERQRISDAQPLEMRTYVYLNVLILRGG